MLAIELTIICLLSLLFLFVGILSGWVIKNYLDTTRLLRINPLHPEFFDEDGDLIPDEVLAVSINPKLYEEFIDEYGSLFDEDEEDDDEISSK